MPKTFQPILMAVLSGLIVACGGGAQGGASGSGSSGIPPASLALSPMESQVAPGAETSFQATLMGGGSLGESLTIGWRLEEGTAGGAISVWGTDGNTCVYTAPAAIPMDGAVYHLTAFQVSKPSICATAAITVRIISNLAYTANPATYIGKANISPNVPHWSGTAPTSFSVTPALPDGLHLDAATGVITGAPTSASAASSYTITASNAIGRTSCSLSIAVVSPTSTDPRLTVLVSGLRMPEALWVSGGKAYLTETGADNIRLISFDTSTGNTQVLGNGLSDFGAVVVGADGQVYLAGARGTIPGEKGSFSLLDAAGGQEVPIATLEIAATHMALDGQGSILVLGSSDLSTAKSLYQFAAPDYHAPQVLATGLGRVFGLAVNQTGIYYADLSGIKQLSPSGGMLVPKSLLTANVMALAASDQFLYYCDTTNQLHRVRLSTLADEVLIGSLRLPVNAHWDAATRLLYVLESGTQAQNYLDGALLVVSGLE